MIAALVLCFALATLPNGAQTIEPGQTGQRLFGPLVVTYAVDARRAQVTVTFHLGEELVGQTVLFPDDPEYPFNFASDDNTAEGNLRLRLTAAPQLSALDGRFEASAGDRVTRFAGTVATWLAPNNLIYVERRFNLAPELQARTTVSGHAKADVLIELFVGTELLYTVSVNQMSPVAVIRDELSLADVQIAAGAKFFLTIPTSEQLGQIVMEAKYKARNIPGHKISGDIAVWSW